MIKNIFLLILFPRLLFASVQVYRYSNEIEPSKQYSVKVNGISNFVLDNPVPSSFVAFGMENEVSVEIESKRTVKWVDVRPLSAGIKPVIQNDKICFNITKPGNYSVEINGKLSHPLFIFANPKEAKPSKNDPNVLFFEAGKVHRPGIIHPESGQQIYIEGGAYVIGAISATGVENIKVSGHGIMDGSLNNRLSQKQTAAIFSVDNGDESAGQYQRFIEFIDSKNISIKGLILNNSTTWQVVPINCENVTISGLKLVSDNPSDDGIDIVRSRNVHVKDCFIRVKDDCVAIKAHLDYPEDVIVDNVKIEQCIFWNAAWGNALEIGFELHAAEVRNITFSDCDIIHVEAGAVFSIHNSDKATVKNVLYENIRVEDARHKFIDLGIFRSKFCTDGSSDETYLNENITHDIWDNELKVPEGKKALHSQYRGRIENITFKNIQLLEGNYPFSLFIGYDERHAIDGVTIENLKVYGEKITSLKSFKLHSEFAKNIRVK
ncbi:Glycosyl hydrolases family 28 [Mariniphaga anaerophila]|uniref:Glycosyl hydrolases family 28 n=1 Tax=Mariniphaga anaerophila TaxID=1484053 RepID=A0A1M4YZL5_9BACT|nr:glycosyl hydrolase family 28 protein [Mariniphaga anaerophila]SHF11263.1 Glycosyl hydrolases family 28 [Mariniphaga anaerophila]